VDWDGAAAAAIHADQLRMTFAELFPNEPHLELLVKNIVKAYIAQNGDSNAFYPDALELVDAYALEDFTFSIDGGELVLSFAEYELTYGYGAPFDVYTGLYVSA